MTYCPSVILKERRRKEAAYVSSSYVIIGLEKEMGEEEADSNPMKGWPNPL